MGIPIAVGMVFLLFIGARRGIGLAKSSTQLTLLLAVATIFFHALFEYPINYLYFLLPVSLIAGAVLGKEMKSAKPKFTWLVASLRSFFFGVSLLIAWGAFLLVSEYFHWERTWSELQYQAAGIGEKKEISLPSTQMLTGFLEVAEVVKMEPMSGIHPEEIERVRKVSERYGWGNLLFKYALISGLNEMPVESKRALKLMCAVSSIKYCAQAKFDWQGWRNIYPVLSSFDDLNSKLER
ncbi:hypothetical protein D3C86_1060850 [compost metagenome]